MKKTLSGQKDAGALNFSKQVFEEYSMSGCILSMTGAPSRSEFHQCKFKNLDIDGCNVGHAIFEKCKFENIVSTKTLTLYDALFLECVFSGRLKNFNFGSVRLPSPFFSNERFLHDIKEIERSFFCIDISQVTEIGECAFIGDSLAKKIRFKRKQGLILKGKNLDKVLGQTLKSTDDLGFAMILATVVGFGAAYDTHFSVIPSDLQSNAATYAAKIRELGVEVIEESLC